jgi:Protein of unknown function (DUF2510)
MTQPLPPGWYPDPYGAQGQRYFDGREWTPHVAPLALDVLMAQRTGGGRRRRTAGFWIVWILVVPVWALIVFSNARTIWFSFSGPVVPVEVVGCQAGGKNTSICTGVWRPTGEPEKTVRIHELRWALPRETVDVRIHGDEAWAKNDATITRAFLEIGFWGIGGLIFAFVVVVVVRKSAP